jgi:hypothetical protein
VQVSGGYKFSVVLKRDGALWGWGDNSAGQLGNGPSRAVVWPGGRQTFANPNGIVQIGTNADWKAIGGGQGSSTLALRQNGTLWTWGNIGTLSGNSVTMTSYPFPIQVCRETNWIIISEGNAAAARNRAGEFWDVRFLAAPPSPTAPASAVLTRIKTGSASANPAYGADYGLWPTAVRYEVRSNGTLWAAPFRWPALNPEAQEWKRFARRHDWISVWGDFSTVFALAADGTLWTWGTDWSQEPSRRFQSGLQALRERVQQVFGGPRVGNPSSKAYPIQKEPRPLMRLIPGASSQTNTTAR